MSHLLITAELLSKRKQCIDGTTLPTPDFFNTIAQKLPLEIDDVRD